MLILKTSKEMCKLKFIIVSWWTCKYNFIICSIIRNQLIYGFISVLTGINNLREYLFGISSLVLWSFDTYQVT